jgi:hypothetical protein
MKNEKQIKILKEIIEKEIDLILLEASWTESNPLYRIFIQPFSDFASVVAGETRKMISATWSALNQYVAIGSREFLALWNPERYGYTARSTIIGPDGQPTVTTGDQAFQNLTGFNLQNYLTQERQGLSRHIASIDADYANVYNRINSNLGTGDAEGLLFVINPGLYAAAQLGRMATNTALDSASVLTGGRVSTIENLRNSFSRATTTGTRFRGNVDPGAWSGTSGMGGTDDYVGGDYGVQLEQSVQTTPPSPASLDPRVEQQYKQRLQQILQQPDVQRIINNQPEAIAAKEYIANGIYNSVVDDDLVKSRSFSEFQSKQPTVAGEISGNIKNLITTRFQQQAAEQQKTEQRPSGTASTTGTASTQNSSAEETTQEEEPQPTEVTMPTEEQLNRVVEEAYKDAKKAQKEVYVRQLEAIADTSPELATALNPKISQVRSL